MPYSQYRIRLAKEIIPTSSVTQSRETNVHTFWTLALHEKQADASNKTLRVLETWNHIGGSSQTTEFNYLWDACKWTVTSFQHHWLQEKSLFIHFKLQNFSEQARQHHISSWSTITAHICQLRTKLPLWCAPLNRLNNHHVSNGWTFSALQGLHETIESRMDSASRYAVRGIHVQTKTMLNFAYIWF